MNKFIINFNFFLKFFLIAETCINTILLDIFFSLWKKNILQFLKKTLQKTCRNKKVVLYLCHNRNEIETK